MRRPLPRPRHVPRRPQAPIEALRHRHDGEVATVVGRGPSLLGLSAKDFGAGPVFVLNHAILEVRKLGLPNPIYSMQKDGCLVPPIAPETLILSQRQSRQCFADYQPRHVIDVTKLGLGVACMSLTFAVALAKHMGCAGCRALAFDALNGDFRTVRDGELVTIGRGYLHAAAQATKYAARMRIPVSWT